MRQRVRRRGAIIGVAAMLAVAAGAVDAAPAQAQAAGSRYFGDGPWEAIRVAAVEVSKPCSVSVDDVRAMMVAPVFKESSAATSPSTSPSRPYARSTPERTAVHLVVSEHLETFLGTMGEEAHRAPEASRLAGRWRTW